MNEYTYIKITAKDEQGNINTEALRVAECLKGSLEAGDEGNTFQTVTPSNTFYIYGGLFLYDEINLPVNTLKICPFLCMKHGVAIGLKKYPNNSCMSGQQLWSYLKFNKIEGVEFTLDFDALNKIKGIDVK